MCFVSCNSNTEIVGNKSGNPFDTINITIDTTLADLVLTNNETTTIKDIKIDLNYEYQFTLDSLRPGKTRRIPLVKFKDKTGMWYTDFKYGLWEINILCIYDNDQLGYANRNLETK